ncbi:MAG: acetyl-CoA carboxylase carboxyltransferase subunit alpha [Candidatus Marinimicrobia bacterium]|nr:acetyl-CoA carboxylase carboxyltransferase subunit alpha [Candidatus Neomarinimicrobiota bacterium]MDD5581713.1 acetyl-CoA carboxylase carboxyltransferase subunit alpha [Candidatus Neomarinimicrobiota bacterium]
MAKIILDFERELTEIEALIRDLKERENLYNENHQDQIHELEKEFESLAKKTYANLNRWQRVQLARHPDRPYTLDYIQQIADTWMELHGDRRFADDPAIVGGIAQIAETGVMIIGHQKGRNVKENMIRNFGMPQPEGYRKALRLMKLSEKFNKPIITFIDTPGAYPGLGAEERGQGEAIARNLFEMSRLRVPILSIVIGEGASGGALGIGVADRLVMLEHTWYSVITPEGCASILFRDATRAPQAAEAMKVTAQDLFDLGIADRVIQEPLGGAHRNPLKMAEILKRVILEELQLLKSFSLDELLEQRLNKYGQVGVYEE